MGLGWKLPKIYYGWYIVGACFLIALYTGGVVYYGFTAFIDPIADELGWSYTQISLAASLRGLEMGFLAPVTGMLVDRWGPRRTRTQLRRRIEQPAQAHRRRRRHHRLGAGPVLQRASPSKIPQGLYYGNVPHHRAIDQGSPGS